MRTTLIDKSVSMDVLEGDGNAFAILGRFQRAARRSGWTAQEIATVRTEAMAGDYDHLLQTIIAHTHGDAEDE